MNYIRETCGCCGEYSIRCVVTLIGCEILTVCTFVLQTARNAAELWTLCL